MVRCRLAAALALLLPAAAAGEVRFASSIYEAISIRSDRDATRTRAAPGPSSDLILPFFKVDTNEPFGETTIFAVQSNAAVPTSCDIVYYDVYGGFQSILLDFVVPADGVLSRNVRDEASLQIDPDGYKRGFASVGCDFQVSGDMFQVNPDQDFAAGSRMIAAQDLCLVWQLRFLGGASFSGGTTFAMYHPNPGGIGPGDPATAEVWVSGEGGTTYGHVDLHTDQMAIEFDMGQIIAALPGGVGPPNGAIYFAMAGGDGFVQASYTAEGRYTVGMVGSCTAP